MNSRRRSSVQAVHQFANASRTHDLLFTQGLELEGSLRAASGTPAGCWDGAGGSPPAYEACIRLVHMEHLVDALQLHPVWYQYIIFGFVLAWN